MKHLLTGTLGACILLFAMSLSTNAEERPQLPKAEFERLWATRLDVVGKVESYTQGKGDALTYEYDGNMHLCSDSIAVVQVSFSLAKDKAEPESRTLRVSVPDEDTPSVKLFKKAGSKIRLSVPLLYLKYDPWGFVPFTDLKGVDTADPASSPLPQSSVPSKTKH